MESKEFETKIKNERRDFRNKLIDLKFPLVILFIIMITMLISAIFSISLYFKSESVINDFSEKNIIEFEFSNGKLVSERFEGTYDGVDIVIDTEKDFNSENLKDIEYSVVIDGEKILIKSVENVQEIYFSNLNIELSTSDVKEFLTGGYKEILLILGLLTFLVTSLALKLIVLFTSLLISFVSWLVNILRNQKVNYKMVLKISLISTSFYLFTLFIPVSFSNYIFVAFSVFTTLAIIEKFIEDRIADKYILKYIDKHRELTDEEKLELENKRIAEEEEMNSFKVYLKESEKEESDK